jgi:hypothetical protein
MDVEKQKSRAAKQHENARKDNMTCIDCHKGIAHKKPQGMRKKKRAVNGWCLHSGSGTYSFNRRIGHA